MHDGIHGQFSYIRMKDVLKRLNSMREPEPFGAYASADAMSTAVMTIVACVKPRAVVSACHHIFQCRELKVQQVICALAAF